MTRWTLVSVASVAAMPSNEDSIGRVAKAAVSTTYSGWRVAPCVPASRAACSTARSLPADPSVGTSISSYTARRGAHTRECLSCGTIHHGSGSALARASCAVGDR